MAELSVSREAFVSCHLCWGGIFGDAALKNTSYGVEKLLCLKKKGIDYAMPRTDESLAVFRKHSMVTLY